MAGSDLGHDEQFNIRHVAIALLCVVFFFGLAQRHIDVSKTEVNPDIALPVIHENGDVRLSGNSYRNVRYGISVVFPEGWQVQPVDDPDSRLLVVAQDENSKITARLSAGTYSDLTADNPDAHWDALWRVVRNLQKAFAKDSLGLVRFEVHFTDNIIAGTRSTLISASAFWPSKDGQTSVPLHDMYFVFGRAPTFFMLQFETEDLRDENLFDQNAMNIENILNAITLSQEPIFQ